MSEHEMEAALENAVETLIEAAAEARGDDDEGTLADLARDMADDLGGVERVGTFESAGLLMGNRGLVLRMADGSEFQISIVRSR